MGLNQKKPGTSRIYLPTGGCDMARNSLKKRFRENTMIIEELESSVVTGPKVRDGEGPELLALSGKKQLLQGPVATQVYNELGKYNETANL